MPGKGGSSARPALQSAAAPRHEGMGNAISIWGRGARLLFFRISFFSKRPSLRVSAHLRPARNFMKRRGASGAAPALQKESTCRLPCAADLIKKFLGESLRVKNNFPGANVLSPVGQRPKEALLRPGPGRSAGRVRGRDGRDGRVARKCGGTEGAGGGGGG
jgi:hypothetical protein